MDIPQAPVVGPAAPIEGPVPPSGSSAGAAAGEAGNAGVEEGADAGGEGDGDEDEFRDAGAVTYTPYRPAKIRIGKPHPDPVVENSTLAAVSPPDSDYEHKLPENALDALSEVQMESVVYAGHQFESPRLTNGHRRGFMIGDGAGVGKGRQLAGIILDSWHHGQKRHIWFSVSPDLYADSVRDLKDLKVGRGIKVYNLPHYNFDDLSVGDGVMFCTYRSLIMVGKKGNKKVRRLDQMIKWWGGEEAEGCILFDEAHKAKNLYFQPNPTISGMMVRDIQDACPNARVVYCSATPCSEPMNMGYLTRLGLWGEGTQFRDFPAFLEDIDARGIGAMELIAMQLKAEGRLVSRTLSFEGCEFNLLNLVNTKPQITMYNEAARFWQVLWQVLEESLEDGCLYTLKTERKGEKRLLSDRRMRSSVNAFGELEYAEADPYLEPREDDGVLLDNIGGIEIRKMCTWTIRRMYWEAHQRFFKALCIAFKVAKTVEVAKKALAEDMCVVVGLQSTGESNVRAVIRRNDVELQDEKFVSAPAEIVKRFIIKVFWADPDADISSDDDFSMDPTPKRRRTDINRVYIEPTFTLEPSVNGNVQQPPAVHAAPTGEVDRKGPFVESDGGKIEGATGVKAEWGGVALSGSRSGNSNDSATEVLDDSAPVCDLGNAPKPVVEQTVPTFSDEDDELLFGNWDGTAFERCLSRQKALLARAAKLCLPVAPLDSLIDAFGGPNAVAEMTGRRERMVRAEDGGVYLERRDANNTAGINGQNNFERAEFNHGRKRIAIISDVASAGISLHANRIYPNTRRRMHITIELPWSADKAIQQLGRTHRANQHHAPVYTLIQSEVCGEARFAAAVAKRLESLGALTQGDRRASHAGAGELGFTAFNIDNRYGNQALNHFYRLCISSEKPVVQPPDLDDEESAHITQEVVQTRLHDYYARCKSKVSWSRAGQRQIRQAEKLADAKVTFFEAATAWLNKVNIRVGDMKFAEKVSASTGNVPRFLNRILGLRIVQQHVIFDYFCSILEFYVKEAKREGTYQDGIRSHTGASCEVSLVRPLTLPEKTGLKEGELQAMRVKIDKSIPFNEIRSTFLYAVKETERRMGLARVMHAERKAAGSVTRMTLPKSLTGFYKRATRYEEQVVLVVDYPGQASAGFATHITVWWPTSGRSTRPKTLFQGQRWRPIREDEAEIPWANQIALYKKPFEVYVVRGPRLLTAWAYLDETYNCLFRNRPTSGEASQCPVVHVKRAKPRDPLADVISRSYGFGDYDDYDDAGNNDSTINGVDGEESFIGLQLPTLNLTPGQAEQCFAALEAGTYYSFETRVASRLRGKGDVPLKFSVGGSDRNNAAGNAIVDSVPATALNLF